MTREALATELLAATAQLAAALTAREQIEEREICYDLARTGEALEKIGGMYRTASGYVLLADDKVIRRLRHPEKQVELEHEARTIAEIIETQTARRDFLLQEAESGQRNQAA
jgi:hypothetical protein